MPLSVVEDGKVIQNDMSQKTSLHVFCLLLSEEKQCGSRFLCLLLRVPFFLQ